MRRGTVIWACQECGDWQWGSQDDYPGDCPECSEALEADLGAAIDTYYENRWDEAREEVYA